MFKIDAADYMLTICGNDALRELSSPGKSGSIFFLSHDDRFLIKTLRKQELKVHMLTIFWVCYVVVQSLISNCEMLLDAMHIAMCCSS
jgi:hypothetical protein